MNQQVKAAFYIRAESVGTYNAESSVDISKAQLGTFPSKQNAFVIYDSETNRTFVIIDRDTLALFLGNDTRWCSPSHAFGQKKYYTVAGDLLAEVERHVNYERYGGKNKREQKAYRRNVQVLNWIKAQTKEAS